MFVSNFAYTKVAQARRRAAALALPGAALACLPANRPPARPPARRPTAAASLLPPPLAPQGVALGVAIAGALAYLYFLARPYFVATLAESRKVAELLSYLPACDVGALMASAAGRGGGAAALQRTSSRSSDAETE